MARFALWPWLSGLFTRLPEVKNYTADLTGKTVVITGANVGLGLEAARHLARMNPGKLILACRDIAKAEEARADIESSTECKAVECWRLDLASFESVKAFEERFGREGGGRLDVLIANAGVSSSKYGKTEDGWELQLQVNHLATSLLCILLLPYLCKAPASPPTPRLVIVTSEMHLQITDVHEPESGTLLEALNGEGSIGPAIEMAALRQQIRYGVSKLLNVCFTRSLSSRLPSSTPLTVNAVNPSACQSSLQREMSGLAPWLVQKCLFRTTEMGSRTLVHSALSRDLQGRSGEYLENCTVGECSDFLLGDKGNRVQERLWDETIEVLSNVDNRVPEMIREYLA